MAIYGRGTKLLQDTSGITEAPVNTTEKSNFDESDEFYKDNTPTTDTTLYYSGKSVRQDHINALKSAKEFLYAKTLDSLLKDKQDKEKRKEPQYSNRNNFFVKFFSSKIVQSIFWIVVISFVLFLLYRLFLADGIFKRNTVKSKVTALEETTENITSHSDFDALIAQAFSSSNFRLAVRYNYLKSLHKLAENGLVQIAPDKTNYQYVREINQYEYQTAFAKLTLHYEYIWYGKFDINESKYQKIASDFVQFNRNFK